MSQQGLGDQLNIPKFEPPEVPATAVRGLLFAIVALWLAWQSFYQVEPEEIGVVVRFGAHVGDTQPGLHFKVPLIDRVYKVPALRELNQEFGFRSAQTNIRRTSVRVDPRDEANMLTGDLNAAVVQWVVQYRVANPFDYLFQVRNVEETFRDMSEAVMREVVGDSTVNELLTIGRRVIADRALTRLNELCLDYKTGLQVERVVLQDVTPPEPVKDAFNAVNQAQQEREKLINKAQSEYNQVIPRARGEAEQTISEAEGYALDRVNRARGEAARFEALYTEYRKSPEATRKRIYLETMNAILPNVGRKIVVDERLEGVVPLLNLTPPKAAAAAAVATGEGGGQ